MDITGCLVVPCGMARRTTPAPAPVRSARGTAVAPPPATTAEDRLDQLARDAYLSVHVADGRFTREFEQLCRTRGITQAQFQVLWVLCIGAPTEGLALGAIADGLLTRAADTSRLVDRLEAAGHLTRSPDAEDRRITLVAPTAQGRALLEGLVTDANALHRAQFGALTPDEQVQLVLLLNKALWSDEPVAPA